MRLPRAALLGLALVGAACAYLPDDSEDVQLVCRSDAECTEGQVCFADGCGDPGQNIVVEVKPDPAAGLHAQDFAVTNLRPQQNLELFGRATLQGKVSRQLTELTPEGTPATVSYLSPVFVRATGESLLIPGLARSFEGNLVPTREGYQLAVGAGAYTVTLVPRDTSLPPLRTEGVRVEPGWAVPLDFLLPASASLTRLTGKVVREGGQPVNEELEIQALDEGLRPLSQRVPVTRETGDFLLTLPPSAARLEHVLVQVTAPRAGGLFPQREFSVDPRPGTTAPLVLEEAGTAVPVSGRVVDRAGQPVPNASVYLQGKVQGGGQFHSVTVRTGAEGRFELLSLPSLPDTPLMLYAIPPGNVAAGITRQPTRVPTEGLSGLEVLCPNKVVVRGVLLRPEGGPAAGVRVVADPVGAVTGWPWPAQGAEVSSATDEEGAYSLRLDPGEYRFDFMPGENLPRVSRFVPVLPTEDLRLEPFTLSKGRRVTGRVTLGGTQGTHGTAGVPYADIQFFRVVNVAGKPTAIRLAQTVADSAGDYTATLPTR
ncbi:carboxypeptidase-like regulatory domain-containing protein [Stigmatella hybrida]|uniref:carboxypeptidase-like regulatory domain-containing protein n=1 Tax=Stigmatella hybrida TaxID=394097 RepID=UPI001CDAB44E|nr:carboxypeptidase-like regulatory domain-containing protein [Stigmatella hybrida]